MNGSRTTRARKAPENSRGRRLRVGGPEFNGRQCSLLLAVLAVATLARRAEGPERLGHRRDVFLPDGVIDGLHIGQVLVGLFLPALLVSDRGLVLADVPGGPSQALLFSAAESQSTSLALAILPNAPRAEF